MAVAVVRDLKTALGVRSCVEVHELSILGEVS